MESVVALRKVGGGAAVSSNRVGAYKSAMRRRTCDPHHGSRLWLGRASTDSPEAALAYNSSSAGRKVDGGEEAEVKVVVDYLSDSDHEECYDDVGFFDPNDLIFSIADIDNNGHNNNDDLNDIVFLFSSGAAANNNNNPNRRNNNNNLNNTDLAPTAVATANNNLNIADLVPTAVDVGNNNLNIADLLPTVGAAANNNPDGRNNLTIGDLVPNAGAAANNNPNGRNNLNLNLTIGDLVPNAAAAANNNPNGRNLVPTGGGAATELNIMTNHVVPTTNDMHARDRNIYTTPPIPIPGQTVIDVAEPYYKSAGSEESVNNYLPTREETTLEAFLDGLTWENVEMAPIPPMMTYSKFDDEALWLEAMGFPVEDTGKIIFPQNKPAGDGN